MSITGRKYRGHHSGKPVERGPCGKLSYESDRQAKALHRRAKFRVRTYYCTTCNAVHVTNEEKS
jgi:hypothetical protein